MNVMMKQLPRILELGNFIVPAYAGMILAEQGCPVVKWSNGRDPILGCRSGAALWEWINHGKQIEQREVRELLDAPPSVDIILDNLRPSTLERWGIDPVPLAAQHGWIWVSMRDEQGERSFDLIAQARATMEHAPHIPFWLGDTSGGLWLAFKALSMWAHRRPGHYRLGQSSCLAKLVEGELQVDRPEPIAGNRVPWDPDPYWLDESKQEVRVDYKGTSIREPIRDRAWKLAHLWHRDGRITI